MFYEIRKMENLNSTMIVIGHLPQNVRQLFLRLSKPDYDLFAIIFSVMMNHNTFCM